MTEYDQNTELNATDDDFGAATPPPAKKRQSLLIAVLALIVVGGGGFFAYTMLMPSDDFVPSMPAPLAPPVEPTPAPVADAALPADVVATPDPNAPSTDPA